MIVSSFNFYWLTQPYLYICMTAGSIKHAVKQITIEKYSSFIEYRYQTSALCDLKKSAAVPRCESLALLLFQLTQVLLS